MVTSCSVHLDLRPARELLLPGGEEEKAIRSQPLLSSSPNTFSDILVVVTIGSLFKTGQFEDLALSTELAERLAPAI